MYFKKKPTIIEAVQLNWKNWNELCEFLNGMINEDNPGRYGEASDPCGEQEPFINITVKTPEGPVTASHGDWIVKGYSADLGFHYWPVKPDYMRENYEVTEEKPAWPEDPKAIEEDEV